MARSDPEKLAQALRANLKRRKAGPAEPVPGNTHTDEPPEPAESPEKSRPQKG